MAAEKEGSVEPAEVEVVKPAVDMSADELKDALTHQEDRDLHPSGKPKGTEAEPGGPPAVEPNRPPYSTNRGDVPILSSLATGSGAHTPPDPADVDADGFVRPMKAEEGNK